MRGELCTHCQLSTAELYSRSTLIKMLELFWCFQLMIA